MLVSKQIKPPLVAAQTTSEQNGPLSLDRWPQVDVWVTLSVLVMLKHLISLRFTEDSRPNGFFLPTGKQSRVSTRKNKLSRDYCLLMDYLKRTFPAMTGLCSRRIDDRTH